MSFKITFDLVGFVAPHSSGKYPHRCVRFISSNTHSFLWAACLDCFNSQTSPGKQDTQTKRHTCKMHLLWCIIWKSPLDKFPSLHHLPREANYLMQLASWSACVFWEGQARLSCPGFYTAYKGGVDCERNLQPSMFRFGKRKWPCWSCCCTGLGKK